MNITVICVGKIKETFYREALAEYAKRLSKYCSFKVIEVADMQTPDNASEVMKASILDKEGAGIISKLPANAYIIATAIEGKAMDSVSFAEKISRLNVDGVSHICFIIGGSLGLCDEVKGRADMLLSFSGMTFPHQLMRVILSEQIYRAFRIIHGEPYHK